MGNNNASKNNSTEMSQLNEPLDAFDQFIQYQYCCGIEVKRVVKRTLIWENTLLRSLEEMQTQLRWPQQIISLVKNNKLQRGQFLKEMAELNNQAKIHIKSEEILLSPSEIQNFKSNLKNSVLLSHAQIAKSSRIREPRIESAISITPQKVKKNDAYIDHFRRSTIVKESPLQKSQKSQKTNFRQSIMSFVDDTISSLFRTEVKDVSKQTAENLETFMHFTLILQKHLNNDKNMLCLIRNCFVDCLMEDFSTENATEMEIEQLTNTTKIFLSIFRQTVENYYNLSKFADNEGSLINNEENLLTVVSSIVFKNEKFYNFYFQMLKKFHQEKQTKLRQLLNEIHEKPPQYFGVKHQYCLNKHTLERYLESMDEMENNSQNIDMSLLETGQYPPYFKCCLALKQITKTRTPISKMKIITDCSEKIAESISEFYKMNGIELKNWVLDADQILSVFCYVLASCKISYIHSHMFLLEHFATDHQLISVTGYYFSVMSCALEQVQVIIA